MIKRYSTHLIGYGSLLFFIGLVTLGIEIITINLIIPISTVAVGLGTIGWILKPRNKSVDRINYVSEVDKGLGYLWDKVIPKFWTGMVILLMVVFNLFSANIHNMKRNWKVAKELAIQHPIIASTFGTNLDFGEVDGWTKISDEITKFQFELKGSQKGQTKVELTLSHDSEPRIINFIEQE